MPRISTSLIRKASRIRPGLHLLLPECRTLEQAKLEYKWLTEELPPDKSIRWACLQRYKHVPLQYILRSQPFGALDIVCKPGVLIPRWETEEWVMAIIRALNNSMLSRHTIPLHICDTFTGTGCIALALSHGIANCTFTAIDVSTRAIKLVKENMLKNKVSGGKLVQHNILSSKASDEYPSHIDILTGNPPYIRKRDFNRDVKTSVKLFEPRLALVGELECYINLVNYWLPKTDSFFYEIGDAEQFNYVERRIKEDSYLSRIWSIGLKYDSNGKARVVYGFKATPKGQILHQIFASFGTIRHLAAALSGHKANCN
ncbi:CGH_1_HP_G0133200.mRNA.1.CDS.1 [Saccharomyces cerevisiae]|nr:CGH_1_HP_G0065050.mRNA.1.CDS.1 [Saccharomyces cerevisiae]CAI5116427.1 CGH_1_HP_G0133200.mRNA.1.CDS.1 [Saccharomyces cerevisiae]CAI6853507.1 CGH_1_HP_G0065050.mRNA.1.CDS.1 [Saccharomyces cerevisiae]CAI6981258.1 CGH_1_HP_G0133200.mRNA.1.CDS.1 [Saccharomyces cerevisiae]